MSIQTDITANSGQRSVVLAATACDNAPVGIPDQDDAALQPETLPCPANPALPAFLQGRSCNVQ